MENDEQKITGKFAKFNAGFGYYLNNIFKFLFTIFKFFVKVSAVLFFTFPFIIIGMAIVAPDAAIKTLEALSDFLKLIMQIFKN